MSIPPRKRRRKDAHPFAVGALLLLVLFVIANLTPRNVTIIDDRFEVLARKFSKRSPHQMFDENQVIGRLNWWIKKKWGVNLTKRGGLTGGGSFPVFLLRYRGRIEPEHLEHLEAILSNGKSVSMELPGLAWYKGKDSFIKAFRLDDVPTNSGPLSVTFKLSNGEEMAIWRIGRLK